MKKISVIFSLMLCVTVLSVEAQTLCPDGSYVGGDSCNMASDGSYVDGDPTMAPDGNYVGDD